MQTIIQRQTEILSQIAQENSAIAQEIINEGTPEEKLPVVLNSFAVHTKNGFGNAGSWRYL